MIDFTGAKNHILEKLRQELNPKLTYHNLCHTLDVHEAVIRLSQPEQISKKELLLLETAALYHDSGMMVKYADHESYSIKIAGDSLPGFGYSQQETMEVSDLIRVTTLPQQAKTHLEKIICDADLDSMGREDFFIQSFSLRLEWKNFGIRNTTLHEWLMFELKFLENHEYYTFSAKKLRDEQKKRNIQEIKDLLNI